jgi:hypothetical protein
MLSIRNDLFSGRLLCTNTNILKEKKEIENAKWTPKIHATCMSQGDDVRVTMLT